MSNSKKEQKNNPILTYCLLFLASIIIGTVSPHGILRALFTLFFYVYSNIWNSNRGCFN